jgi:Tfp pilus assembly protein PilV
MAGRRRGVRRGLTMMETALATLLVGLSILAVVRLITAVTEQNFVAQKTTTALMLADNIHELLNGKAYNDPQVGNHLGPISGTFSQWVDVQSFNGFTSPATGPVDAQGQTIPNMTMWQQSVTVKHINPSNFQLTDSLATDSACNVDRVLVTVSYNSSGTWMPIATVEWLKSNVQ